MISNLMNRFKPKSVVKEEDKIDTIDESEIKRMEYESKMATERGLLEIGKALLLKEQEVSNRLELKNKLLSQIREYKTKSMLVSSVAIVDKVNKYLGILYIEKLNIEKELNGYKEDYESTKDELDMYIKEVEEIEEKILNYWTPRVNKLREKCISKNIKIQRMWYLIRFQALLLISIIFYNWFNSQEIFQNLY